MRQSARFSKMRFWFKAGLLAGAAMTLAACQTATGYDENGDLATGAAAAKPSFPVRPDAGPIATQPPAPQPAPTSPPPPAPSPEVVTRPLPPPVSAAPPPPPTPEPAPRPQVQAAPPPPPPPPPPRPTVTGKVVEVATAGRTYTVKQGQGLDAVARELDSDRKELAALNGLKEPYALRLGQKIKGPPSKGKAYVVNAGDTMFSIAKRFNVTAEALAKANGLKAGAAIKPGQKITLPSGFKDKGPVMVASAAPEVSVPRPYVAPAMPTPQPPAPRPPAPTPQAPPVAQPPVNSTRPNPPAPPPGPTAAPIIERGAAASAGQVRAAGAGKFIWPIRGRVLSCFGVRADGGKNDGVNIAAPMGASVRASAGGEVIYAGDALKEFGNLVLIQHSDGFVTAYGYMSKILVKMKDKVAQNQEIGEIGQSGGVTQPQLHFETRYARTAADSPAPPVDPMLVLPE
ncbi:hypothetical protein BH11PSE2_BH11PSE2_05090 [soil metagenome]